MNQDFKTKSAFVAIVGLPNVGKSSLLNALVGEKVAIISPKPQTTRNRITGILTLDETQIVFIDTPGIHQPHTKLSKYMVAEINEGMADIELAIVVTEAFGKLQPAELQLFERLQQRKTATIVVLNKIDLLEQKEEMMDKIQTISSQFGIDQIIPISALNRDGVEIILDIVKSSAVPGPHFFENDAYTDQPERVLIAEMVREKLLYHLREELPHGIAVVVESMKDRDEDNSMIDLHVTIYCERDSHKGMIIGKGGKMLKRVATESRKEIEHFLDTKVNMQCWVKVKPDWRNREGAIREFGFN